ncbi:MAG TPA: HAMP domain-containing sensor histidine kinase [Methylomirabilota bacterium]|nr:HAMP domain-containing sensor histidine kinase [Methylomirabilota bacterium]
MLLIAFLAVALAAAEVALDFATWIQLNVSILYGLPLILAALARSRRLLWSLVAVLATSTFTVYWLQIPPGVFALHEPFFVNRVLATVSLLLTACLAHVWIAALDLTDRQSRTLQEQNAELHARRQDAEEASRRKTRVLRAVSHDIRSPLHAIKLVAELVARRARDPAAAAEIPALAQRLLDNTAALADWVTNVLDFSTVESGQLVMHASEFSLDDVLAEEAARLLPLAERKGLKLTARPPAPPIRLKTDRTKLGRVLSNLLNNAIKFTEAGKVAVTAEPAADGGVDIEVRDTGVGIPAGKLELIFQDSAQLDSSPLQRGEGWGLGLPVCHTLLRLMGGRITVESEPSVGSRFTVHLPPACVLRS